MQRRASTWPSWSRGQAAPGRWRRRGWRSPEHEPCSTARRSPLTQSFGLGLTDPVHSVEMERLECFFRERGAAAQHEVSPLAEHGAPRSPGRAWVPAGRAHQRDVSSVGRAAAARRPRRRSASAGSMRGRRSSGHGWRGRGGAASRRRSARSCARSGRSACVPMERTASWRRSGTVRSRPGRSTSRVGWPYSPAPAPFPAKRGRGAQRALLESRLAFAGASGLRSGDDGCAPRERLAAQRRASGVPRCLHPHQVGARLVTDALSGRAGSLWRRVPTPARDRMTIDRDSARHRPSLVLSLLALSLAACAERARLARRARRRRDGQLPERRLRLLDRVPRFAGSARALARARRHRARRPATRSKPAWRS
jgi:hypothetical protein